jgi:hypothetical protein
MFIKKVRPQIATSTILISRNELLIQNAAAKVAAQTGSPVTAILIGTHNANELKGATS